MSEVVGPGAARLHHLRSYPLGGGSRSVADTGRECLRSPLRCAGWRRTVADSRRADPSLRPRAHRHTRVRHRPRKRCTPVVRWRTWTRTEPR
jgi:hypothetical protein